MIERPWVKNYTEGVPADIDPNKYADINTLLKESVQEYGDQTAFYFMDKSFTYKEVNQYAEQFAGYLIKIGIKAGDRIALMMPNMIQYPIALMGCVKLGVIAVNTNPLYTPREMQHQFKDAGVTAIVIAENFAYNLESILDKTDIKHVVITSIGELLGLVKGGVVNFVIRKVKKLVPQFNLPQAVRFKNALKLGNGVIIPDVTFQHEDVVVLQYTGGTTGIAKGAMLTNRNLIANMLQIREVFITKLNTKGEMAICPLPMYHIFAFTVHCLALFKLGCPSVLVINPRDIKDLVKTWSKYSPSIFPAINTLFNALCHNQDFKKLNFSNLKVPIAGGMALQNAVADQWEEITGVKIVEGYGLTETSPVASVNPLDGRARKGSIGMPVSSTYLRIVDENGKEVNTGEIGEIQIKGPQVMKGYYNRPEETACVIKDGWFSSGDIGLMEEDGFFRIVDRKKDMILVSGFNVYPNEIEEVAMLNPKVLEVAAIGKPDEKSGEVVKLFVVKKDQSLTEEELQITLNNNLTNYKRPRYIEFRTELPKTNVGKILRRVLRDEEIKNSDINI